MKINNIQIHYNNDTKTEFPYSILMSRYGDKYPLILKFKDVNEVVCNISEILDSQHKEFNDSDLSKDTLVSSQHTFETYLDGIRHSFIFDADIPIQDQSEIITHLNEVFTSKRFLDDYSIYKTTLKCMEDKFTVYQKVFKYNIDFINHDIYIYKI